MKLKEIDNHPNFKDIKIIKFEKFSDNRGYFTEHFRKSDFQNIFNLNIMQCNQSYSYKNVIRGLHFQWNNKMGKLIRAITGHFIDVFLDIRINSPTYGCIGSYELNSKDEYLEWIYVPEGFAHGCIFLEDSIIEYFCNSEYAPTEACINIFSDDINWKYSNLDINNFKDICIMSPKDKNGFTLEQWEKTENYKQFYYLSENEIIVTGGSGLLGTELKTKLIADYPSHQDFDITNYDKMENYIRNKNYKICLHCAATTSPPNVEKNPIVALETNIIGTTNLVKLCSKYNIKLIYISTDYVFDGKKGNYKEEDSLNPVNKYSLSKLGGETAVRMYSNSLTIRLSLGANIFPYEKAYIDQYTSRECVREISEKIIKLLNTDITGIIHIGHPKRSVYDYAISLGGNKEIGKISFKEMKINIPEDTSLDTSKYDMLFK